VQIYYLHNLFLSLNKTLYNALSLIDINGR